MNNFDFRHRFGQNRVRKQFLREHCSYCNRPAFGSQGGSDVCTRHVKERDLDDKTWLLLESNGFLARLPVDEVDFK